MEVSTSTGIAGAELNATSVSPLVYSSTVLATHASVTQYASPSYAAPAASSHARPSAGASVTFSTSDTSSTDSRYCHGPAAQVALSSMRPSASSAELRSFTRPSSSPSSSARYASSSTTATSSITPREPRDPYSDRSGAGCSRSTCGPSPFLRYSLTDVVWFSVSITVALFTSARVEFSRPVSDSRSATEATSTAPLSTAQSRASALVSASAPTTAATASVASSAAGVPATPAAADCSADSCDATSAADGAPLTVASAEVSADLSGSSPG
mmetsp:Transcript_24966/g.80429  ORF Transcript_24966/g.80429 Transcript_24966/m.80429 type:complete len:270 (+) Transcript_24966:1689-2498(+)